MALFASTQPEGTLFCEALSSFADSSRLSPNYVLGTMDNPIHIATTLQVSRGEGRGKGASATRRSATWGALITNVWGQLHGGSATGVQLQGTYLHGAQLERHL